jgi:hypothetical protein
MIQRATLAVAVLAAASACALPIHRQSRAPIPPGHADFETTVQVRFLGVAGFMIRRGQDVVITAPLYSHPALPDVVGDKPTPIDEAKVAACHRFDDQAAAMLVGHAHYDHLMDVPPVWRKAGRPAVIGSQTAANILAGYGSVPAYQDLPGRVVVLPEPTQAAPGLVDTRPCFQGTENPADWRPSGCAGGVVRGAGDWFDGFGSGAVRIRGLCARHPPQFAGLLHLWPGSVCQPRATPPLRANDYQEGPVLAYLIDFLDRPGGSVVFRVYYQDAPSDGPIGQVPAELIGRPVDLALLAAGTSDVVDGAEDIIENTRASHVLVGHWEKFFRILGEPEELEAIPGLDVKAFLRKLRAKLRPAGALRTLLLPAPGVQVHYRTGPPSVLDTTKPAEPLQWCRY